ncbi:MAG: choice-of-anchor J domain-containing protein [Flavobacterium sp.]|uniref:T9SS-dependent choice-of-anchor J family protein n=1 Tax=Flavobacterium sp. TaxID=239 RepID=UPI0022C5BC02|nr:choice-of-anchor J domain-containing protein [Flavobacterium sp.]MCZ8197710.1 choice-of-anchor J domain-containing protein [Flavobacterium sp.]
MKKKLLIIITFISLTTQAQMAKVNIDGNYQVSGTNSLWAYRYRPVGTTTYFTSAAVSGSPKLVKLNPFIAYEFSRNIYNSFGQPTLWETDVIINSSYETMTPKTVGYSYDFNSIDVNEGWRGYRLQNTSGNTYSDISEISTTSNVITGESLFVGWSNNYGLMLVSPKIADLSTDKKFSFYAKSSQGNYTIQLGTIASPNDPTTFHPLKTITINASSGFQKVEVFMNNYQAIDNHIAVKTYGNSGTIYLENFAYEQSINCFDNTNLTVTNINENNALISFDSDQIQNNWELYVKNLFSGQIQTITISENPYTIQNLIGNTNYEIKVRAICSEDFYSNWTPLSNFQTTCNTISSGYYTSFEETTYINPCWKSITNNVFQIGITSGYLTNGHPSSIAPQTGIQAIKIKNNQGTPLLITPQIQDLSQNKRIRFSMYSIGGDLNLSSLMVGTMTDPNDTSTFSLIETILPSQMNDFSNLSFPIQWKEYIINMDNYSGTGNYIAFKHSNTSFSPDNFIIDDFYYETQPICVQPINQKVINEKFNEVTLSWEQMPSSNATEFEIEYGIAGFTQGTGVVLTAISSPYTITNITQDDTTFDFYIRSKCGTEYSNWTKKQTFTTKCEGITAGYTTSFDDQTVGDIKNCWKRITPIINSSFWSPGTFINPSTYLKHSGTKSIFIKKNTSSGIADVINKVILVSPRLIDFNNYKRIKFWLKSEYDCQLTIGTLSTDNDYTTFTPYQNITLLSSITSGPWTQYEVDFSNYYGTDKFIGIKISESSNNAVVYIDDFEYLESPCPKPTELIAHQTSIDTASLAWNDNNQGNTINWEIEYGSTGFTTGTLVSNIASSSYLLNGLTEGVYEYRVRANCSSSSSSVWSNRYKFKISCTKNTPFYEDFTPPNSNQTYLESLSKCWTFHENASDASYTILENVNSFPYVVSLSKTQDSSSPYLIKKGLLVSPFLEDFDATKKIKFWLNSIYENLNGTLTIGTILNPYDKSTFVPYQNISFTDFDIQGKEYEITFENYTGIAKHIAFQLDGVISNLSPFLIIMDDLYYGNISNCTEPIDINVSNETNSSALISWQVQTNSNNYEIEYGVEGFTLGTGTIVEVTNANSKLLTNLVPSTKYDYYTRSVCNTNSSLSVGPKKFSTTCNPQPLPWMEKFNSMTEYGMNIFPNCFKKGNGYNWESRNSSTTSGYPLTGFDDTYFLKIGDFSHNLFTPTFYLEAGTTYTFSYKFKKGYAYSGESISLFTGLGNTLPSMKNKLSHTPTYPNYSTTNYFKINTAFTPIVSGNYTFYINFSASGGHPNAFDDFELKEGYNNIINNPNGGLIYNFNSINNDLIFEGTQNTTTSIIVDQEDSSNSILQMKGSSGNEWNAFGNVWENNQNSISKLNMKVNTTATTSLFMKFDLNQTFADNADYSKFRVIVNGTIIDEIESNLLNRSINSNQSFEYNLSQYIGSNIRISLQHVGKTIQDNAYLDNLTFSPTASLTSTNFDFESLKYYPNPANNELTIENNNKIESVTIYNYNGQIVNESNFDSTLVKLNIANYATGIYFAKITSDDKIKTIKFIKN